MERRFPGAPARASSTSGIASAPDSPPPYPPPYREPPEYEEVIRQLCEAIPTPPPEGEPRPGDPEEDEPPERPPRPPTPAFPPEALIPPFQRLSIEEFQDPDFTRGFIFGLEQRPPTRGEHRSAWPYPHPHRGHQPHHHHHHHHRHPPRYSHQPYARSTRSAFPPTWGQVKALCHSARRSVLTQGVALTPETLLLAMLAIISCQVLGASATAYWSYLPDPPILHPTPWDTKGIKVVINNTDLLGGQSNSYITPRKALNFNYTGLSHTPPICLSMKPIPGCLPLGLRTFMTDSPTEGEDARARRELWTITLRTAAIAARNHSNILSTKTALPSGLSPCPDVDDRYWPLTDRIEGHPRWLPCGWPNRGVKYPLFNSSENIYDWSISSPGFDYRQFASVTIPAITQYTPAINWQEIQDIFPTNEPIHRWASAGFIAPVLTYYSTTGSVLHPDLWRLIAASAPTVLTRPTKVSRAYHLSACLNPPHAVLIPGKAGSLSLRQSASGIYEIRCSNCILTNCIKSSAGIKTMLIVHQPSYVMLPVNLTEPWYENRADYIIDSFKHHLSRPRRFVAALILGITALISIIASLAASTTALVQEIHTAHTVDSLSRNISLALSIQEKVDRKLEARINALEEAIIYIGNQIQSIKIRMTTQCHSNYKWICVTPAPYNASDVHWNKIQNHLQGVWNHTDLSLDMGALHQYIGDISHSGSALLPASEVANDLFASLNNFVTGSNFKTILINLALIAGVLILFILFLPVALRVIGSSLRRVQTDLHLLRLNNKKGGIAGSRHGAA